MSERTTRKSLRAGTFSTTFLLHYLLEYFSQNIGIHGTECFLQNTDMLAQIYNEVVHHIPQVDDQVHKQCRSLGNPSTKCAQWLRIQHKIFRGLGGKGGGGDLKINKFTHQFLPVMVMSCFQIFPSCPNSVHQRRKLFTFSQWNPWNIFT